MLKAHVPALLIAALLLATAPVSALAATSTSRSNSTAPNQDGTHPRVMQETGDQVATAKLGPLQPFTAAPRMSAQAVGSGGGPQREVFGFALLSSLADPTIGYPSWNFSLLSTVAVFGLHVNSGDGTFVSDSGWAEWNSSDMTNLLTTAHNNGVKVVVTIILQDFSPGTPQMCAGLANRATTVAATVAQVNAKGVDGVNIDYEGLNGTCPNGQTPRAMMTDFVRQMKAALVASAPGRTYLSVDTYASSAGDPAGFFDIPGMNPYADSFFVMAYDSDWSNYNQPPLNCSSYCLNPVSPLSGYYYNDTNTAATYVAAVPAGKVILGLPYYSRGACVGQPFAPHQYPVPGSSTWTLSYRASVSMATDPTNSGYAEHRDATDGVTPWSTWISTNTTCQPMEMYWDDVVSLGSKYDLVNRDNLRGVGLWNLNLGGGSPELWSTLSTYFSCPVTVSAPASPATTEFSLGLSAGGCSVASFEVQQFDATLNQGWFGVRAGQPASGSATAVVEGYPNHNYVFKARAYSTGGVISSWTTVNVSVPAGATYSHPFKALYTLDGYGGLHAVASPPLSDSAYWAGWDIARSARGSPTVTAAGFVLDGFGGLHPYGAPGLTETSGSGGHYWPGFDIARDFAFMPDGSGGFVLDGYGGLHAFHLNGNTTPLSAQGNPYWGWDIARKVVIFPDGKGGYILDGWGGIHAFGINGAPVAATTSISGGSYWPGWDIARDIALVAGDGGHSGYLLDGYGGIHPFNAADGAALPPIAGPYWGQDFGRSLWFLPGNASAAYVIDAYGGVTAVGGAPTVSNYDYWPGWKIVRAGWGV
jgi:spore germination protein YaaH